jgi:hypothetical protein
MVRLPYLTALTTLFSYGLLFAFGHFRDFFRRILDAGKSSNLNVRSSTLPGRPAGQKESDLCFPNIFPGPDAVPLADSVGLRAHLLGVRGFLHAPPLPPHPGEGSPPHCNDS